MNIFLTRNLSNALLKRPKEDVQKFIDSINKIKDLNKSQILKLDTTIELAKKDDVNYFAYEIGSATYVLFTFRAKKMILLDVMTLKDHKKLDFLVAGNNNEQADSDS